MSTPSSTALTATLGQRKYKYVSLTQKIIRNIARQNLKSGDRIGTENELCEQYGLSRITIRKALAMLEEDGFIYRKQKKGTFVKRPVDLTRDLILMRGTVVVAMQNNYLDPVEAIAEFTFFRALERGLAEQGFSVRVIGLGTNREQDRLRLLQAVEDKEIEGVCSIGSALEPYAELIGDMPLVTTCTFHPTPTPWVGMNMEKVTFDCIEYLIRHGHREIAVMCGPWIESRGLMDFTRGFRAACDAHDLPFRREHIFHAFEGEPLQELAKQILTSGHRPTAVFAEDWKACNALLAAATELDMSLPQDVSLIGCGQNVTNIQVPLALDTYLPDTEGTGKTVVQLITKLIDGKPAPQDPVHLDGRIVARGSVRQVSDSPQA